MGYIEQKTLEDSFNKRFAQFVTGRGYDSYEAADRDTKLVCDGFSDAIDVYLDVKPVDAVKVIRCKDCQAMTGYGFCRLHGMAVTPEDYCSRAERK